MSQQITELLDKATAELIEVTVLDGESGERWERGMRYVESAKALSRKTMTAEDLFRKLNTETAGWGIVTLHPKFRVVENSISMIRIELSINGKGYVKNCTPGRELETIEEILCILAK